MSLQDNDASQSRYHTLNLQFTPLPSNVASQGRGHNEEVYRNLGISVWVFQRQQF